MNSSEDGPTYNYCKFYEPKLVEGVCSFNKDNVIDCAPDAEFTFAPFNMDSSVATENNMYCSQYIWTPTIDSFFMIGLLAGSFIFGVLSDKIGRRHSLAGHAHVRSWQPGWRFRLQQVGLCCSQSAWWCRGRGRLRACLHYEPRVQRGG